GRCSVARRCMQCRAMQAPLAGCNAATLQRGPLPRRAQRQGGLLPQLPPVLPFALGEALACWASAPSVRFSRHLPCSLTPGWLRCHPSPALRGKSVSDLRAALEEAILAHPEDRASHAAYADLLTEEGDPQGEFVSVQLALEDESLPAPERQRLKA